MAIINNSGKRRGVGENVKKGEPPTLLVGKQAGAATLENSMEVPQKVANRAKL